MRRDIRSWTDLREAIELSEIEPGDELVIHLEEQSYELSATVTDVSPVRESAAGADVR